MMNELLTCILYGRFAHKYIQSLTNSFNQVAVREMVAGCRFY